MDCRKASTAHARRPRSFQVYRGNDGDAERQRQVWIEAAVDVDLDRHALHDFHEIARRVLRRKGGEFRSRSELNAVDMAFELKVRIGIHLDVDGLTRTNAVELSFLEIGGHPDFGRDDRKDRLA